MPPNPRSLRAIRPRISCLFLPDVLLAKIELVSKRTRLESQTRERACVGFPKSRATSEVPEKLQSGPRTCTHLAHGTSQRSSNGMLPPVNRNSGTGSWNAQQRRSSRPRACTQNLQDTDTLRNPVTIGHFGDPGKATQDVAICTLRVPK